MINHSLTCHKLPFLRQSTNLIMKVLILPLIFVFAFVFVTQAQSDIKLRIGAKLPRKYTNNSEGQIVTAPSQSRPFIRKTIAKVDYIIAFEEKSRKIRFIQTLDKDFRTSNGLHTGSKITLNQKQLNIYQNWHIFAPTTPDGWRPIVIGNEDSLNKLKNGETKTITIGGFIKGGN